MTFSSIMLGNGIKLQSQPHKQAMIFPVQVST